MSSPTIEVLDLEQKAGDALQFAYAVDNILSTSLSEVEKSAIPDDFITAVSKYIIGACEISISQCLTILQRMSFELKEPTLRNLLALV